MNEIKKAKKILLILNKTYPKIDVPLKSRNVFTLLISVLLSAQCTDINVNNVTKNIYPKYYKPKHFIKLGRKKIEILIKRIGIFRDEEDQTVAFTGTSKESFSDQTRDFEYVDVFTSWNDKTRVERKMKDFENLWKNKTKYVDVCDFMYAEENNLLKYSSKWVTHV